MLHTPHRRIDSATSALSRELVLALENLTAESMNVRFPRSTPARISTAVQRQIRRERVQQTLDTSALGSLLPIAAPTSNVRSLGAPAVRSGGTELAGRRDEVAI